MEKMTANKVVELRKALLKKIEDYRKKIEKEEWQPIVKLFLKENVSIKKGKVYELVANGVRRIGFKRFVPYVFEMNVTADSPMIRVGGWWLDETSTPAKWDTMTIYGVSNAAKFKLSDNQVNNKVPKEIAERHGAE